MSQLSRESSSRSSQALVKEVPVDELVNKVCSVIHSQSAVQKLTEILYGFAKIKILQPKRKQFVEALLNRLKTIKAPSQKVDVIVDAITVEFSQYSKQDLTKFVEFCHATIRDNDDDFTSWKDILPRLLETLQAEKHIVHQQEEISGAEYKSAVVEQLCQTEWKPEVLPSLAKMFKDMLLNKEDHEKVFRCLCSKIVDGFDLEAVPVLVHQLLEMCRGQDGRVLLRTLRSFFNKVNATAVEDNDTMDSVGVISTGNCNPALVKTVESTVFYLLLEAAQQDVVHLDDTVTALKSLVNSPELILERFITTLMLQIAEVYREQICDIMRLAVTRKIQEDTNSPKSALMRQIVPREWNFMATVEEIIKKCSSSGEYSNTDKDGRQIILNNLMELGFSFLTLEQQKKDLAHPLWTVGEEILRELAKVKHAIASTIFKRLIELMKKHSDSMQYIEFLSYMCKKYLSPVMENKKLLDNLIESILSLTPAVSSELICAVMPVIKLYHALRDTLVMVLRKALYKNDIDIQIMAANGFIELLKFVKIRSLDSLSQTHGVTQQNSTILTQATMERYNSAGPTTSSNKALSQDIIQLLRKCFYNSLEVRLALYRGFCEVVVINPKMLEDVISLLLEHFEAFHESDENIAVPIHLDLCSKPHGVDYVLEEPLAHLIYAIQVIYVTCASSDLKQIDDAAMILESLSQRISSMDLENLNLDEFTDLGDVSPKSQQKMLNVKLMFSVYEALIAFKINTWNKDNNNAHQSFNLLKKYNELNECTKKMTKTKKDKKKAANDTTINNATKKNAGRLPGFKVPPTILDLNVIQRMFVALYSNSVEWASPSELNFLRGKAEFHHYVLQAFQQALDILKQMTHYEFEKHMTENKKRYYEMGQLIYQHAVLEFEKINQLDIAVAITALTCFKELSQIICSRYSKELSSFIKQVCNIEIDNEMTRNQEIVYVLANLKQIIKLAMSCEEEEEEVSLEMKKRIRLNLFETVSFYLQHVVYEETDEHKKILDWLLKLAKNAPLDAACAAIVLNGILAIEEAFDSEPDLLNDFCQELDVKVGLLKKDDEDSITTEKFKMLNSETLLQVHLTLNSYCKQKMNGILWILNRLKAEQDNLNVLHSLDDDEFKNRLKEKEKAMNEQISSIIQCVKALTNIPPGNNADAVLKNLQLLYNIITLVTKYFHNKSTEDDPAFKSVKFLQIIQLAGKDLRETFYDILPQIDEALNSELKKYKDTEKQKFKATRETRIIPKVVCEIEQFDKSIILLSKKTKVKVPLETYMKTSVTRDFRIINKELRLGIDKMNVSNFTPTQATADQDDSRSQASSTARSRITSTATRRQNDASTSSGAPPPKRKRRSS